MDWYLIYLIGVFANLLLYAWASSRGKDIDEFKAIIVSLLSWPLFIGIFIYSFTDAIIMFRKKRN